MCDFTQTTSLPPCFQGFDGTSTPDGSNLLDCLEASNAGVVTSCEFQAEFAQFDVVDCAFCFLVEIWHFVIGDEDAEVDERVVVNVKGRAFHEV